MAVVIKTKPSTPSTPITIFTFGPVTQGSASMKNTLGGKGANLAEMASLGLPVPPGFTIPCEASVRYKEAKTKMTGKAALFAQLWPEVDQGLESLKAHFGYMPLLSVRSGARVSMPGMMDTILNVGMSDETLPYWSEKLGARAALDSYRRLIQMFSSVALNVPMEHFEEALSAMRKEAGCIADADLSEDHLSRLVTQYLKIVAESGEEFPQTLQAQLHGAVVAVFESWDNPRAKEYRKIHGYSDDWGTAVTIQSMVFGNMNDQSATGVVFTRCPSTGKNEMTGEFLVNAQGEDVVAGIRTPDPIHTMESWDCDAFCALTAVLEQLEAHYKDMQDVEFTVQNGSLYLLQTRNAKRSPQAAFKVAYDLVEEGVLTKHEAVGRVTQAQLLSVMQDAIDPAFKGKPHFTGIPAGGGVVTGVAMFSSENAVNCTEPCILVTKETDPDDIAGMNASVGILTATGGLTSHAAVVARGMNKSCVVGATDMAVSANVAFIAGPGISSFTEGQTITIDGATGNVWVGVKVPMIAGGQSLEVATIIGWALGEGFSERLDLSFHLTQERMSALVAGVQAKSLYVDTALLEGSTRIAPEELVGKMLCLGNALLGYTGEEVIIDLGSITKYYAPADFMFDAMFRDYSPHKDNEEAMAFKTSAIQHWEPELRAKVTVKMPDACATISALLAGAGVKVMGKVSTVADLLASGGPVDVSEEVIQKVFGSAEAYQMIKAMIEEKTGKSLSGNSATPLYWYDSLNKAA